MNGNSWEFLACFAAFCGFLGNSSAAAQVSVLQVPGQPERTGLVSALNIQLTGVAKAQPGGVLEGSGLAEKVAAARRHADESSAELVLWVEGPVESEAGDSEVVLYLVGDKDGRALVEILRLEAGEGPAANRTLALKVREVLDAVRVRADESEPMAGMLTTPQQPRYWGWALDVGVFAGAQSGSSGQWGLNTGLGILHRNPDRSLGLSVGLRWLGEVEIEDANNLVRFSEMAPSLTLRGQLSAHDLRYGLAAGLLARFLSAQGSIGNGDQGKDSVVIGAAFLALESELYLTDALAARLGIGLDFNLRRQRFAVDDAVVADLGRVRPFAELALVVAGY